MKETEADFATWFEDLLHRFNWTLAHFRPAKTEKGWRTAVSCDGAGFPDYICISPVTPDGTRRLLVVELKSATGKVSPEQQAWLEMFAQVESAEVYIWRPAYREEIEQTITLGHTPNLIESEYQRW